MGVSATCNASSHRDSSLVATAAASDELGVVFGPRVAVLTNVSRLVISVVMTNRLVLEVIGTHTGADAT